MEVTLAPDTIERLDARIVNGHLFEAAIAEFWHAGRTSGEKQPVDQ